MEALMAATTAARRTDVRRVATDCGSRIVVTGCCSCRILIVVVAGVVLLRCRTGRIELAEIIVATVGGIELGGGCSSGGRTAAAAAAVRIDETVTAVGAIVSGASGRSGTAAAVVIIIAAIVIVGSVGRAGSRQIGIG